MSKKKQRAWMILSVVLWLITITLAAVYGLAIGAALGVGLLGIFGIPDFGPATGVILLIILVTMMKVGDVIGQWWRLLWNESEGE
jgi:thiol:disulfide interchange protein